MSVCASCCESPVYPWLYVRVGPEAAIPLNWFDPQGATVYGCVCVCVCVDVCVYRARKAYVGTHAGVLLHCAAMRARSENRNDGGGGGGGRGAPPPPPPTQPPPPPHRAGTTPPPVN